MLLRRVAATLLAVAAVACFGPEDSRPGLHLTGPVRELPADWGFSAAHREIALEVHTPYLLPHSVTIWCVAVDGDLYLGARNPEQKRWPAWADRDPDVRLRIGEAVYEVRLQPLAEADAVARVREAYAEKYELPATAPGEGPPMRYWLVAPRA